MMEFMQLLPDDAARLGQLWRERFSEGGSHAHWPKCVWERRFHRAKTRDYLDEYAWRRNAERKNGALLTQSPEHAADV
jgi:hypothetical protein